MNDSDPSNPLLSNFCQQFKIWKNKWLGSGGYLWSIPWIIQWYPKTILDMYGFFIHDPQIFRYLLRIRDESFPIFYVSNYESGRPTNQKQNISLEKTGVGKWLRIVYRILLHPMSAINILQRTWCGNVRYFRLYDFRIQICGKMVCPNIVKLRHAVFWSCPNLIISRHSVL